MLRLLRAFLALFILCLAPLASPPSVAPQDAASTDFPAGSLIPRVVASKNPQQTYALYLPSHYSAGRKWPVVFVFDPLARGQLALQQFQHAAETYGFIVAASNNSRNGPWQPQFEAADAMLDDTQRRFTVDLKRIYFAGFSGGARVSARLAQICNCAAGVLLSGAGFPVGSAPSRDSAFAVFSAVGNADFNYPEIFRLEDALEKSAAPHWLRVFDGPHEWAPSAVIDEALAWFHVQAIKSNREPRDASFLEAQLAAAKDRVARFESSGNALSTLREYSQASSTFASLLDVTALTNKATALRADKSVREALKQERSDFDEQERLTQAIFAAPSSFDPSAPPQTGTSDGSLERIRSLRERAAAERNLKRALVIKRALGGIFIGSIEAANDEFNRKDYPAAARNFAEAAEANPDSEWVYRQLAVARSLAGDRKGALKALNTAREKAKDKAEFDQWLGTEAALANLN